MSSPEQRPNYDAPGRNNDDHDHDDRDDRDDRDVRDDMSSELEASILVAYRSIGLGTFGACMRYAGMPLEKIALFMNSSQVSGSNQFRQSISLTFRDGPLAPYRVVGPASLVAWFMAYSVMGMSFQFFDRALSVGLGVAPVWYGKDVMDPPPPPPPPPSPGGPGEDRGEDVARADHGGVPRIGGRQSGGGAAVLRSGGTREARIELGLESGIAIPIRPRVRRQRREERHHVQHVLHPHPHHVQIVLPPGIQIPGIALLLRDGDEHGDECRGHHAAGALGAVPGLRRPGRGEERELRRGDQIVAEEGGDVGLLHGSQVVLAYSHERPRAGIVALVLQQRIAAGGRERISGRTVGQRIVVVVAVDGVWLGGEETGGDNVGDDLLRKQRDAVMLGKYPHNNSYKNSVEY